MAAVQVRPQRLSSAQNGGSAGLLQLQIPSINHQSFSHQTFFQQQLNSPKEEWFSLEGFLYMKCQGGALTFLQSKKRMYFGLEELENKLIYYRDKADFDRKKDCLGTIQLNNALCSLIEGNLCAFVLHTTGKKYIMEAENEMCAHCWLNALQQRVDINDNELTLAEPFCLTTHFIRRHRSRSRSVPQIESDSPSSDCSPQLPRTQRRKPLPPLQISPLSPSKTTSLPPTPNIKCRPISLSNVVSTPIAEDPTASSNSQLNEDLGIRLVESKQLTAADSNRQKDGLNVSSIAKKNGVKSSEPQPPKWLENWINSWLSDQLPEESASVTPIDLEDLQTINLCSTYVNKFQAGPSIHVVQAPSQSNEKAIDLSSYHEPRSETTSRCDSRRSSLSSPMHCLDELSMLKAVDNRQKEKIHQLNLECTRLVREVVRLKAITSNEHHPISNDSSPNSTTQDFSMAIAAQNRFLNSELLRINDRCMESDRQLEQCNKKIYKLETEMEDFKKEYVYLLQSCVRIPLHEHSSCDVVQVKLFGGDVHERRVKMLLERARESDPTLPTFESVTKSGSYHVDDYGFRHTYDDIPLALHYIATQLNEHYDSQSEEYINLKHKWRTLIEFDPDTIERNRENRHLCRLGVPRSMRSKVWRILINQQVAEIKSKYGEYYYRNLCSSQGTPAEKHYCANHQKQINLDLLRTMPSNVHFQSASCKGVTHLQAILRAYCLHNPTTGYCQGMNFLAATALLFVSPEDAFWFLVAITERYFCPSYFDQSLTGAQADQEVLKEIVEQKFPRLSQHLEECDIDLTTITLNWFLALFFDAVPFQTMLRIWDCFLFEGPKVLFRFTIALLGLYEEEILDHSDTISVMKVLKAAVRLTYDVDGLIKYAFDELNPFPSKAFLKQRHSLYLEVLEEKLYKRLQLRKMLNIANFSSSSDKVCDLPIESITFSDFVQGCGYVCAGNQKRGKLSMISFQKVAANLNTLNIEFDCRPVSMVIFHEEMAFVSLLSGYIVAIQLHDNQAEILWELKLNDVALKLLHCENRLYAMLANGTLAVLENAFEKLPTGLDLYHIPVSAAPITDALLDDEHLYLAVACKIVILNRITLSTLGSIYVASSAAGSHVPMFEKIRAFSNSPHGIWLITANSALIQLWKNSQCQMLFDITYDHSHRSKPSFDEDDQFDQVEVYCIMFHDREVWIGTVDGYLMLYKIVDQTTGGALLNADKGKLAYINSQETSFSLHRYPPGKRLSPIHTTIHSVPNHRHQMYYIPTETETQVEESASVNEYPESERRTRKISLVIDSSSRKYSVNVQPIRTVSADSANENSRVASSSTRSSFNENERSRLPPVSPRAKQNSIDSAVSVFSSSDGMMSKGSHQGSSKIHSEMQLPNPDTSPRREIISRRALESGNISGAVESPLFSMTGSMEYDDYFEIYSENEQEQKLQNTGLVEDSLLSKCHNSIGKLIQIPVKKLSGSLFSNSNELTVEDGTITSEDVSPIEQNAAQTLDMNDNEANISKKALKLDISSLSEASVEFNSKHSNVSTSSSASSTLPQTIPEEVEINLSTSVERPSRRLSIVETTLHPTSSEENSIDVETRNNLKLRRKDLHFDETLLVAVKETETGTDESAVVNWSRGNSKVSDSVDVIEREIKSSLNMVLQMKLKISDKPVKCITATKFNGEDVVVTGAGNYGDEEAILRWRREKNSGLWINDPIVDPIVRGKKRTLLNPNASFRKTKP